MADPASIRYWNPGAMWPGPSATAFGATGFDVLRDGQGNKIARFPDAESGAAAQFDLLKRGYTGMRLADAVKKWSGGNHWLPYTNHIAQNTGLPSDTVLTPELLNDPGKAIPLARSMAAWEAGRRDQAGRLLPYPMSDEQWGNAHKRYLGGPTAASTASPASAPITTGSTPGSPPMADFTPPGLTPEEVARRRQMGQYAYQQGSDASPVGHWTQALARVMQGANAGMWNSQAQTGEADYKAGLVNALKSASTAGDIGSMGRGLISSGYPELANQGLGLLSHDAAKKADLQSQLDIAKQKFEYERKLALELERQKREDNMKLFNQYFGGGLTPPQPLSAAPSAIPQTMPAATPSISSGVPGVSLGQMPAPQAGQSPLAAASPALSAAPSRSESPFDKRRLGMAVAAGIISPDAAKLMMESNKYDDAYDAEAGKDFAAAYKGYRESLPKLNNMLGTYGQLEKLIQNPATIQGMGAGARKTFDRAMEAIGIKTEGLAPTQVMEALANEMTLQMRGAAGGMPGAMSDNDLKFLRAMTANTENSPEANLFLVQMRKRVLEREQMVAKMALNYAQNNGGRLDHRFDGLLQQWAEKNPLWSEAEMKALSGQKDQAVPPGATPQAAAPAPTIKEVASAPVGTVLNGMRKIGPGQWVEEAAGATPQVPAVQQPQQPSTQAQRIQARRADAARAEEEKAAKAKQENDALKAAFDADLRTLDPVELVRKYDSMRWRLGASRLVALEDALAKAGR